MEMLCVPGSLGAMWKSACSPLVKGVLILMTRWDMSAQHFERAAISFIISNILAPFVSYMWARCSWEKEKRASDSHAQVVVVCVCALCRAKSETRLNFYASECVCTRSGAELKEPRLLLVLRCNFWKTTSFWNMKGDVCTIVFFVHPAGCAKAKFY